MKFGKKLLSVLLSLLMVVSMISVSFSTFTVSAISTDDVKTAFQKVTNTTDMTNGDGTLLKAAEALYSYVNGIARTNHNSIGGDGYGVSLSAVSNNSSVDLNNAAKSVAGSAYNTVINKLIPTSGVCDDSARNLKQNQTYTASWPSDGFKSDKVSYGYNSDVNHSVTVSANLEKILLHCASLADVEKTILLSATYSYNNSVKRDYRSSKEDKKKWGVTYQRIWHWSSASWHTLSQKPVRSNVKTDTNAYVNLHAFADYFTDERLAVSLDELCRLSAKDINAIIADNNTYYSKLNSYSANVKKHFFNMDKVEEYMSNCLFAQKVINALPAMNSLKTAVANGYDNTNLSEMNEIYTVQKPNFEFIKATDDAIVQYITANFDGYSDFSLVNA